MRVCEGYYPAMAAVIDADSHVDETEATWEYMSAAEAQYRPTTVSPDNVNPVHKKGGNGRFWNIDGYLSLRRIRDDDETGEVLQPTGGTTTATRELTDVPARLKHMDDLGIDVQVMYSTLFIDCVTDKPDVERAVTNSYNRWLGDRSDESKGRLRWVIVPSMLDIPNAIEQIEFGSKHGAAGVCLKGEGSAAGTHIADPYFDPLYKAAADRNLPIVFHIGRARHDHRFHERFFGESAPLSLSDNMISGTLPVVYAFHTLATFKVPDRFPTLRFGFIEANSSWIPYMMYDLKRRITKQKGREAQPQYEAADDLTARNRFFVTCQVDEDIPTILKSAGEGCLVIGTDYSHPDASYDLQVVNMLRGREDLPPETSGKILSENPAKLYGI